jgi:anti-sigma B factor antagonist
VLLSVTTRYASERRTRAGSTTRASGEAIRVARERRADLPVAAAHQGVAAAHQGASSSRSLERSWSASPPAVARASSQGEAQHRPADISRLAPVQSHFRLEVRNQGQTMVIALSGELDLASSPALQEELDRVATSDAQLLIIDLRDLDFMDSTGLSVLVRAHQRIEEQGRQLAMVKGPQQVQRLLSLTGVAERLKLVDSPEELLSPE